MFGKVKKEAQIDKEQLELIENAQKRIKQKKRLYIHFVVFLIGSLFLILLNLVLGFGKDFMPFNTDWFVFAVLIWLFFLIYHTFNVFVTHRFMGKAWEQEQLNKLVAKQKERIEVLNQKVEKENSVQTSEKKKSELTIIVAAAENNAIGKDNQLIWHLSDDLKRFKNLTKGHHIIMGRKTFESFPNPLPNRTHVVITRQEHYKVPEGVIVVNSLEDALDAVRSDMQPFVIGGGEIYKQAMAIADRIEITRVHASFEADTFFPEINTANWKKVGETYHRKDEKNEFPYSFITYTRV
ncbi:dihydrofolate reductase [Flavobacteriaceae bacterium XHP0103]|uniref:dihydrofolate reductase n=1 Tax=Marixanthotalea marina TaxID=2844359 RepID=UPI002989F98B|nr:dihydrofolate reductase [Marixanthotalea marina]MBU3821968.1 dihydrofolate reductase [Marixanthotalea marina]